MSIDQAQCKVDTWNENHPVGQEVNVHLDLGATKRDRTRSKAFLLGGHTACIMLDGTSGAYALDRVEAVKEEDKK